MSFLIGSTDQYTDPNSVMDPQVLIAAKAINVAPNKGAFYQRMVAPLAPLSNTKFEVYSRTKASRAGLLNGAITNAATTITVDDVSTLTQNMVVQIESELVIVNTIDYAANTFTVFARGAGNTTAAAHADNTAYVVNGVAGRDVDLANLSSQSESTLVYENAAQLFLEALDYTYTAGILERQGLNPKQIQAVLLNEALIRTAEAIGRTAIVGRKQLGSSTQPAMTAGLIDQLSDATGGRPVLTMNAGAAFSETVLKAALKTAFQHGSPDTIVVSPANKVIASSFNLANTQVGVSTALQGTVAGSYIDQYVYEGKTLQFITDADVPDTDVPIVTIGDCKKAWLKNDALRIQSEPAKSSREIRKSLQGTLGLAIENVGQDHILIQNIT